LSKAVVVVEGFPQKELWMKQFGEERAMRGWKDKLEVRPVRKKGARWGHFGAEKKWGGSERD
jgi:hypothetical protein